MQYNRLTENLLYITLFYGVIILRIHTLYHTLIADGLQCEFFNEKRAVRGKRIFFFCMRKYYFSIYRVVFLLHS